MPDYRAIDWKLITAIAALTVAIVGVFGGALWRRADVVFDKRAVEIPLSDALRKSIEDALVSGHSDSLTIYKNGREVGSSPHLPSAKLPDKLLYVDLKNVGHVPSAKIIVRLVVPGEIADKDVSDAGRALGPVSQVTESDADGELSFECQNLADDPQAKIKISLWYQQTRSGSPSVQIEDTSEGPAREVSAVDVAQFYWWERAKNLTVPLTAMAGLLGSVITLFSSYRLRQKRSYFTAVYDPLGCGWSQGSTRGRPAMQIFARATLATTAEHPVEIVQAYLEGTRPIANLPQVLVASQQVLQLQKHSVSLLSPAPPPRWANRIAGASSW